MVSAMKTVSVSVSEAKAQLSRILRRVACGETVVVVHRGRPVARIEPVRGTEDGAAEAGLAELEREGVLRRGRLPPDARALEGPRPRTPAGKGLVAAVAADREERL
jgi:prevent-host-death family protein